MTQNGIISNIRTTRLKIFSHIARADPSVNHSRVLRSSVAPLPRDWNRRSGRPRQTWLRTFESDMFLHSTLVWQLPIIDHKIDKHGGCPWERQRLLDKDKPHDDDDIQRGF